MKQKKEQSIIDQVKSSRKQSRNEEIKAHGKPIHYHKIIISKKQYNRKKNKADDEVLPYFFIFYLHKKRKLKGEATKYLPALQREQT